MDSGVGTHRCREPVGVSYPTRRAGFLAENDTENPAHPIRLSVNDQRLPSSQSVLAIVGMAMGCEYRKAPFGAV